MNSLPTSQNYTENKYQTGGRAGAVLDSQAKASPIKITNHGIQIIPSHLQWAHRRPRRIGDKMPFSKLGLTYETVSQKPACASDVG